ncbi:MAG: hypothetical protein V3S20_07990, partial [Dehalococcoidia bacterium]
MTESHTKEDLRSGASSGRLLTLVLLCQTLDELGNGLDLAEVRRWFQETDSAVQIEIVSDLCKRPDA